MGGKKIRSEPGRSGQNLYKKLGRKRGEFHETKKLSKTGSEIWNYYPGLLAPVKTWTPVLFLSLSEKSLINNWVQTLEAKFVENWWGRRPREKKLWIRFRIFFSIKLNTSYRALVRLAKNETNINSGYSIKRSFKNFEEKDYFLIF